jgi:hypothetical protein
MRALASLVEEILTTSSSSTRAQKIRNRKDSGNCVPYVCLPVGFWFSSDIFVNDTESVPFTVVLKSTAIQSQGFVWSSLAFQPRFGALLTLADARFAHQASFDTS